MEIKKSLLPTSETYSRAILSGAKIPKMFAPTNNSKEKSTNEVTENGTKYSLRIGGVLHPQGDDYDGTRKKYNDKVKSFGYKMREGYQDSI